MRLCIFLLLLPVLTIAEPIVPGNRNIQSIEYTSESLRGILFNGNEYTMCDLGNESLQGANLLFRLDSLENLNRESERNRLFPGQYPKESSKELRVMPCVPMKKDAKSGKYSPRFQIERRIDVKEIIYENEKSFASVAKTTGWQRLLKTSAYTFTDDDVAISSRSLVCGDKPRCYYFISNVEYRISYDGIVVLTLHSSEFYE